MSDGFKVNHEQVGKHADTVEELKAGIELALDAARHVAALDDAYGWICQGMGLPEMLRGPQDSGAQAIATVDNQMMTDASKLDATAECYRAAEAAVGLRLAQIVAKLESAADVPTVGGR